LNQRPAIRLTPIESLGETLFKLRDYTPIPLVILAIIMGQPTVASLLAGLFLALFGEVVRIYGVAFIGTISRTRSYSNGELVSSGPFALLRNPLYFGNLLLTLGLSIMPHIWWFPPMVVFYFYVQYIPIVSWEEKKLVTLFGSRYQEYQAKVPNRWFPRLGQLLKGGWYVAPDSWEPALKSEKRTLTSLVTYLGLMLLLWAGTWGWLSIPTPLIKVIQP